jgi:hypothetical protein
MKWIFSTMNAILSKIIFLPRSPDRDPGRNGKLWQR